MLDELKLKTQEALLSGYVVMEALLKLAILVSMNPVIAPNVPLRRPDFSPRILQINDRNAIYLMSTVQ